MIDVLLWLFGLLSKEFFISFAEVVNLERNPIANIAEIFRDGAAADEGVERVQDLLELFIEPFPFADFNRRGRKAEEV